MQVLLYLYIVLFLYFVLSVYHLITFYLAALLIMDKEQRKTQAHQRSNPLFLVLYTKGPINIDGMVYRVSERGFYTTISHKTGLVEICEHIQTAIADITQLY